MVDHDQLKTPRKFPGAFLNIMSVLSNLEMGTSPVSEPNFGAPSGYPNRHLMPHDYGTILVVAFFSTPSMEVLCSCLCSRKYADVVAPKRHRMRILIRYGTGPTRNMSVLCFVPAHSTRCCWLPVVQDPQPDPELLAPVGPDQVSLAKKEISLLPVASVQRAEKSADMTQEPTTVEP